MTNVLCWRLVCALVCYLFGYYFHESCKLTYLCYGFTDPSHPRRSPNASFGNQNDILTSPENLHTLHNFAAQVSQLFKQSKENTSEYVLHLNDLSSRRTHSIPLRALKALLRRLNLIDGSALKHHDVDIILTTLNVKQVSVYGK